MPLYKFQTSWGLFTGLLSDLEASAAESCRPGHRHLPAHCCTHQVSHSVCTVVNESLRLYQFITCELPNPPSQSLAFIFFVLRLQTATSFHANYMYI